MEMRGRILKTLSLACMWSKVLSKDKVCKDIMLKFCQNLRTSPSLKLTQNLVLYFQISIIFVLIIIKIQLQEKKRSTVETRYNDPEGTMDFWSLNPNVVKSNF